MGKYINAVNTRKLPSDADGKCDFLLANGAVEVDGKEFLPDLVCVVDNYIFSACGYAYDEREYNVFASPNDDRPKRWFVLKDAHLHVDK